MLLVILILLAAYLIGSIPFGFLVARLRGVNIFELGSGNIGATNVGRVLGRKFGILVFVLDFAKGAVPVLLARWAESQMDVSWLREFPSGSLEVAAGLLAFLGHVFPLYLGFRGGKGVATGAGVVAMLVPAATGVAVLTWLLVLLAFRYVSLASVCAALALIGAHLQLHGMSGFLEDPRSWFCLLAGVLVIVRHRTNLARLAQRRENRLQESAFLFGFSKAVHVLCVGLWFGSTVFFSFIVAPKLFAHFEAAGLKSAENRLPWFPLSEPFAKQDDTLNGPREQGIRAAGYAVSPLFPAIFILQIVCGLGALATALPWIRQCPGMKTHPWRLRVLLAALVCVVAGWPLENRVRELQGERHARTLAYLTAPAGEVDSARTEMQEARQAFGRWHGVSLLLSMIVIGVVGVALVLAAFLPGVPIALPPLSRDSPLESADK